ncbi:MAG: hypothetical protein R3311_10360, partial [Oceanisphaera sp.]|nr:hypothetical protein [Oceanisphaera sp.]
RSRWAGFFMAEFARADEPYSARTVLWRHQGLDSAYGIESPIGAVCMPFRGACSVEVKGGFVI